ncbi:nucleoside triphosphate pyrophosphohydrolase family protein [Candidatus Saccharibacteria bacterium]|nr:nucleoside triphosphate pyrophosphohydrolase family protein [Candidatus Saccharibacteria bacterium]
MNLNEYQKLAKKYDSFEPNGKVLSAGMMEKILGLVGEAGETVDKFKKVIRDKNGVINAEDKEALTKELGDVLWYVASTARYLDVPLDEIARKNIDKLQSRYERNKLHGEGDDR